MSNIDSDLNENGDIRYTYIIQGRLGSIDITKIVVKYNISGIDFEHYLIDVQSFNADIGELRISWIYGYEIIKHTWDGKSWILNE